MRTSPPWWDPLTTDAVGAELGITWHPPAGSPDTDSGESRSGTMSNGALDAEDARIREGKLLVGTGPQVVRRGVGYECTTRWYLDPAEPDRLWCALGDFYPAWLWVPIEPTGDAVREVLDGVHPRPALTRLDMTGRSRGFLGWRDDVMVPNVYSGEPVEINGHDLDRYHTFVGFVEPQAWGSNLLDDPFRDDLGSVRPIEMIAASKGTMQQRLGRVPSMTWRTLHSRSYLSYEIHTRMAVCVAVRYRPAPESHRPIIARAAELFGASFPDDLPLDVIGALTCYDYSTEADLEKALDPSGDPEELAQALRIFAALHNGDLRRTLRLREYAGHPHPEVRRQLFIVAAWYRYDFLLYELALTETDPENLAELENLIQRGAGPDTFNAFGDYFGGEPLIVDGDGNPVEAWDDDEEEEDDE